MVRPRLIGLLAAHFASSDLSRVERLRRLLHSVEEQTWRVPLLVSWSAEEAEADKAYGVAGKAQAVLDEFQERGVIHAMPRLRGRRSQFQHYARLRESLRRHVGDDAPWVFFSDDDDLWHPKRAEEYGAAIQERPNQEPVVHSRIHLTPGLGPRLPLTARAADVTRMEADGLLRVAISAEQEKPGLFGTATGEYFDAAAEFHVFDDFFERHNDRVIANQFADIRFRTHLLRGPGRVHRFLPRSASGNNREGHLPWMYFYDRPTMPYSTPPGEEDLQYVSTELPDPKRIAGMRQTLDCVLFQLTPTKGPLEITEQEFAQSLVGTLNEVTSASGYGLGPLPEAWSESCEILGPAQTAIVQRIELRLAQLAKLPIETLERLVVVRYEPGQEFTVHHDGKFRPITIFLYLNELPDNAGGDTFFPHLGFSFVPRTGCAVMWPNAQPDGKEDSRMVHAGRPPTVGVKFGVNCFFNVDTKRLVMSPSMNMDATECHRVDVAALEAQLVNVEDPSVRRRTFTLNTEPQIRAVPHFLTPEEVREMLADAETDQGGEPCFGGATVLLKTFPFGERPVVETVEARLISWNEFAPENLGQLKLVRGNTQPGLGNRGGGQRCASICLCDQAEVHFPHLGLLLAMRMGDLVEWPNAWFQEETDNKEKVTLQPQQGEQDARREMLHGTWQGHAEPENTTAPCWHTHPSFRDTESALRSGGLGDNIYEQLLRLSQALSTSNPGIGHPTNNIGTMPSDFATARVVCI
ncbi:unnamed protein product [Durusdinium trenchii]|uniref:procollagen-lysine 5-dioxygenase n=1 Tax=Durusdinium trenchii TaxID=1381693 RepID=A0ABP0P0D3_9DINO